MKTYLINNISKFTRRFLLGSLMLFALAGNAWAQTDQPYVIKLTNYNNAAGDHYLAHVKEDGHYVLQDTTTFSPDCLWYSGREISLSGTNHNYYFIDDNNQYRFLSAPLEQGGSLSLSNSQPPVYLLNNTDHNYYFYDWDYDNRPDGGGVARGHQYNGITGPIECQACAGGQWHEDNEECWAVYWVEFNGTTWRLSTVSQYNITENSGRFRGVTVTSIPMQIEGTGGLDDLASFEMEFEAPYSHGLSATISNFNYIPAYNKYTFNEVTDTTNFTITPHTYYYPHGSTNTDTPTAISSESWTYNWTISGEGAEYLSFTNEGEMSHTSSLPAPTLYYRTVNNTGDKQATLTLTVTYSGESRQTKSTTVTVKTPCQNPQFSANVNYEGVTISWTPTAESYVVSWKKQNDPDWQTATVDSPETSFFLDNLEYATTYDYKVKATCDEAEPDSLQFTTLHQPKAVVGGAVFGGGRMANVGGNTEVVIINTDSIAAVYGGNDIAGSVLGADGSTIILGVPDNTTYNNGSASTKVRVGDVYGGGNGYYAYNGTSFEPASNGYTSETVAVGGHINAMTQSHQVGEVVWTNGGTEAKTLSFPTIVKTSITVNTNVVKVDSIFGGAKNAFITNDDADANGTSITVNGGTAFAVFGGNNFGGNQTAGKHHIVVNNTKNQTSGYPDGLGRNYGIGYVFGGGNKVVGLTTDITIKGGMCDTVFAGGNAADVGDANVKIDCAIGSGSGVLYGNIFSNAIQSYNDNTLVVKQTGYDWNGTGIYNVRALFGGNNRANMSGLPTITLTSGSVGTVYGGGNAGKMLAQIPDDDDPVNNPGTGPIATDFGSNHIGSAAQPIYYGTHVVMNSANMLVDYLYGGCQMSDVVYSTWVEIQDGHVGTVYGGCNISGDVGSEPRIGYYNNMPGEEYQLVKGGTYVKASGGTVYHNLFAGSNGFYHCNNGVEYISGLNFGNPPYDPEEYYVGLNIPTHNETHVVVSGTATVKENVYAGGDMAFVGFINATDQNYRFRDFVGFCSVLMDGGVVEGSVYGGGNRASVFGSNAVHVSGGSIGYVGDVPTDGALYGGNDRAGQVAQITNRVLPDSYSIASDGETDLKIMGVKTYVGIDGKPKVSTVYGGGNGAYDDYDSGHYCDPTDKPVQSNTFVDINIDARGGAEQGGYINTVYGGGNGVTVLDRITVFVNVANMPTGESAYNQVGTIFGGNNKGDLDILSDIIMLKGQAHTIYGGCNEGAMTGSLSYNGYDNLGSMVHLRDIYKPNGLGDTVSTNAKVTGFVYGGCRSNGVSNNTLVLVDGGEHPATFFGGSDISGNVFGTSRVVVTGGTIGDAYGGGNGLYDYTLPEYSGLAAPFCFTSEVFMLNGAATGNLYAGGLAGESGETNLRVKGGTVGGKVFGGGNRAGVVIRQTGIDETDPEQPVTTYTSGSSTIMMDGGTVLTGIYGGCNAFGDIEGDVRINLNGGTVGSLAMLQDHNVPQIFGGGYGAPTNVRGNVEVNMWPSDGDATAATVYGDIYGGSALGNVNTNSMTTLENYVEPTNTTTVNIMGGTVKTYLALDPETGKMVNFGGNIYGGGLGDAEHAALVHGVVHVNIGYHEVGYGQESSLHGEATLIGCNVFGCNNVNGSPRSKVYVDVYRTAHIEGVNTISDDDFAIGQVFGGGNHAHYAPLDVINPDSISDPNHQNNLAHHNRTHVYVHGCQNTIDYVYGGGNAADALGVETIIEGGRFNEVYGGGNGRDIPANIGDGSLGIIIHGGHVNYFFEGCNKQGIIGGKQYEPSGPPEFDCGELIVDSYFFGDNEAEHIGDMENIIECADAANFNYKYVYAGSRWATIYGNVTLTVRGGHIENLFGGSRGYNETGGVPIPADIRKYPSVEQIDAVNEVNSGFYSQELRTYMVNHPELVGKGGNIILRVEGGTIGNVIGGCDEKGNVEGKITVIVENISNDCGLFVGNIYGASNETDYEPTGTTLNSPTPEVTVIEATVGGTATFASSEKTYEGNVFGGGNIGSVKANPKVVIGSTDSSKPVTIKGNVFGGGKLGRVDGNTEVIIVPTE